MFDITNYIRASKNEGWENYRQLLLNTYPQKNAEENLIIQSNKLISLFR